LEAVIWAQFYLWKHCFSDRETAYYYSLMSYTTVGYGDVVLAHPRRLRGTESDGRSAAFWMIHGLPCGLYLFRSKRTREKTSGPEVDEPGKNEQSQKFYLW
jgi:Ion channel